MNTRPSLLRSIPFWILVAVSVVTLAVGAWILTSRLGLLTMGLTENTATAVDVYVGPSVALFGAVLVGAGVIGILLALAVAAAASLRPKPPVEVVEPIDWDADEEVEVVEVVEVIAPGDVAATPIATDAPVTDAEPVVADAAPVTDAEPVVPDAAPVAPKDADEAPTSR
jgi:hypothetical protein